MIHLQLPFLETCAALLVNLAHGHAYFRLAGGDTESGSQAGAPETSNSCGEESSTADLAPLLAPSLAAAGAEATAGLAEGVNFGADSLALKLAPALAAAAFAATTGARVVPADSSAKLPASASATEARRSTSMRNGCPEEYSA